MFKNGEQTSSSKGVSRAQVNSSASRYSQPCKSTGNTIGLTEISMINRVQYAVKI